MCSSAQERGPGQENGVAVSGGVGKPLARQGKAGSVRKYRAVETSMRSGRGTTEMNVLKKRTRAMCEKRASSPAVKYASALATATNNGSQLWTAGLAWVRTQARSLVTEADSVAEGIVKSSGVGTEGNIYQRAPGCSPHKGESGALKASDRPCTNGAQEPPTAKESEPPIVLRPGQVVTENGLPVPARPLELPDFMPGLTVGGERTIANDAGEGLGRQLERIHNNVVQCEPQATAVGGPTGQRQSGRGVKPVRL